MKSIKLSKGLVTIVDDSDYDYLMHWKWCSVKFGNRHYAYNYSVRYMHRFILEVIDPKIEIDHIDDNGLNNQRYNIRIANRSQNMANRIIYTNNTSGYKGVSWNNI